ncbi:MAG: hypothetical protein ACRCXT_19620 [Paraclostridium sp.]
MDNQLEHQAQLEDSLNQLSNAQLKELGLDQTLNIKLPSARKSLQKSIKDSRELLNYLGYNASKALNIGSDIAADIKDTTTEQTSRALYDYLKAVGLTEDVINDIIKNLQTVANVADRDNLLQDLFKQLIQLHAPAGMEQAIVDDLILQFNKIRNLNSGVSDVIIMTRVLQDSFKKFAINFDKDIHAATSKSF